MLNATTHTCIVNEQLYLERGEYDYLGVRRWTKKIVTD